MPLPRAVRMLLVPTDPFNGSLWSRRVRIARSCHVGSRPKDHYKTSLKEQGIGEPSQGILAKLVMGRDRPRIHGPAQGACVSRSRIARRISQVEE